MDLLIFQRKRQLPACSSTESSCILKDLVILSKAHGKELWFQPLKQMIPLLASWKGVCRTVQEKQNNCFLTFNMSGWCQTLFMESQKSLLFLCKLCDPMDYTVHGILQAKILEWVAIPFSGGSSQPRDRTQVSHIAGGFLTIFII